MISRNNNERTRSIDRKPEAYPNKRNQESRRSISHHIASPHLIENETNLSHDSMLSEELKYLAMWSRDIYRKYDGINGIEDDLLDFLDSLPKKLLRITRDVQKLQDQYEKTIQKHENIEDKVHFLEEQLTRSRSLHKKLLSNHQSVCTRRSQLEDNVRVLKKEQLRNVQRFTECENRLKKTLEETEKKVKFLESEAQKRDNDKKSSCWHDPSFVSGYAASFILGCITEMKKITLYTELEGTHMQKDVEAFDQMEAGNDIHRFIREISILKMSLIKNENIIKRKDGLFSTDDLERLMIPEPITLQKECPICMLVILDKVDKTINCKQCMKGFHRKCIAGWFKTNKERPCPNCRWQFPTVN